MARSWLRGHSVKQEAPEVGVVGLMDAVHPLPNTSKEESHDKMRIQLRGAEAISPL